MLYENEFKIIFNAKCIGKCLHNFWINLQIMAHFLSNNAPNLRNFYIENQFLVLYFYRIFEAISFLDFGWNFINFWVENQYRAVFINCCIFFIILVILNFRIFIFIIHNYHNVVKLKLTNIFFFLKRRIFSR